MKRPETDWEIIEEAIIKGELPPWFEAERIDPNG